MFTYSGMPTSTLFRNIAQKHCMCTASHFWYTSIPRYRRSFSSGTDSTPNEALGLPERKALILWQLKLSTFITGMVISAYGAYVVVSSGFQFERSCRKFALHWNSLLYGNKLPPNIGALLNSRFNVCLSPELLQQVSAYFIKFDLAKDNGVRRRDVILFLESVGIGTENTFVDRFIAAGTGESKEHRFISGCSLQEFAELLEVLVLEDRINGGCELESKLTEKLKEFNGDEETTISLTPARSFRLNNPLVSGAVKSLSEELRKYIQHDIKEAEASDLQHELDRNYKIRDKLEQLASTRKLSESESRRLNAAISEISLLEGEVLKQNHTSNILWWM